MPAFWIKPDRFIALDSRNTRYLLNRYKIDTTNIDNYQSYCSFTQDIIEKMRKNEIKEKSFAELSSNAFFNQNNTNDSNNWYDSIVETWKKRKTSFFMVLREQARHMMYQNWQYDSVNQLLMPTMKAERC